MKAYGYVFVVLVLGMVAATTGQAAPGQTPKNGGPPGASGKAGGSIPVVATAVQA
jgi:hypothetical protein